jgi:hypothetical protein
MSNLTGKFISNTYQKLLQVDNINGANGDATLNMTDARTSTKYNLLNGLGQNVPYLVIDNTDNGNGSIFLKNTGKDSDSLWGIQIEDSGDVYGSSGLNFWRPSGSLNEGNKYLFLKNTGTTWVGFQSQNIFNDVIEYSTISVGSYRGTYTLYVSDGILVKGVARQIDTNPPTESLAVGAPTNGSGVGTSRTYQKLKLGDDMTDGSNSQLSIISNNSSLQIYGSASNTISVVDNAFDFYMQEYSGGSLPSGSIYHPFRIVRYKYDEGNSFEGPRSRKLVGDGDGNPPNTTGLFVINSSTTPDNGSVDINKWAAVLVGWTRTTGGTSHLLDRAGAIIHCDPSENAWRVSFTIAAPGNAGLLIGQAIVAGIPGPVFESSSGLNGSKDQDWYFDVMFIRKGFYDDYRPKQLGDGGSALDHGGVWGAV